MFSCGFHGTHGCGLCVCYRCHPFLFVLSSRRWGANLKSRFLHLSSTHLDDGTFRTFGTAFGRACSTRVMENTRAFLPPRKWVKEEFGSPADFFTSLDTNKKGKASHQCSRRCDDVLTIAMGTSCMGRVVVGHTDALQWVHTGGPHGKSMRPVLPFAARHAMAHSSSIELPGNCGNDGEWGGHELGDRSTRDLGELSCYPRVHAPPAWQLI